MVYLKHTTEQQELLIPKNGGHAQGVMSFKAFSTINLAGFVELVEDRGFSQLFYTLPIKLASNVQKGEYEYTLFLGADILSTGILIIGEGDNVVEYDNIIRYEQYEQEG